MRRREAGDREANHLETGPNNERPAHDRARSAPSERSGGPEAPRADTLLLVANDPATRALARQVLSDPRYRVFECPADDLSTFARSIQIDIVVMIGERTRALQAKLRAELADHPIPADRIVVARSISQARLSLERVLRARR